VFVSTLNSGGDKGMMQVRMDLQEERGGEKVKRLMEDVDRGEDGMGYRWSLEEECWVVLEPVQSE
jgi:hypothetical protein